VARVSAKRKSRAAARSFTVRSDEPHSSCRAAITGGDERPPAPRPLLLGTETFVVRHLKGRGRIPARVGGDERPPIDCPGFSSSGSMQVESHRREGTSTKAKGDDGALSKQRLAPLFCAHFPTTYISPQSRREHREKRIFAVLFFVPFSSPRLAGGGRDQVKAEQSLFSASSASLWQKLLLRLFRPRAACRRGILA
jgi:hypothetical protein